MPSNIAADLEAVSRIPVVSNILEVVCRTTNMGFAAIALVTDEKWIACAVRDEIAFGLKPGGELTLETTLCNEIRQHHQPVIIDHVDKDAAYAKHHTPAMYGFQSYISVPITLKNGRFFGTLCAIDPKPATLNTPEIRGMFTLFAELIAFHLHAVDEIALSEKKLLEEKKNAELREQFIAILGHDLRNPVSAVAGSAQLQLRMPMDEPARKLAGIMKNAAARMTGLLDNVLDFARGRMGSGIGIQPVKNEDLEAMLLQVISELQISHPDVKILSEFNLSIPVTCDGKRVAQLFSNLLGNALSYGKKDAPIRIVASSSSNQFTLSVANVGEPIPPAAMERLFQPFSRGEVEPNKQGLGLGLYIASEIARAHNGTLNVISTPQETCFTLRMPA